MANFIIEIINEIHDITLTFLIYMCIYVCVCLCIFDCVFYFYPDSVNNFLLIVSSNRRTLVDSRVHFLLYQIPLFSLRISFGC